MLDLLYHKRNSFIETVVDGSIFLKNVQNFNLREKHYFYLGNYTDEIIID